MKLLISFKNLLVDSLGFSIHKVISSANSNTFTSFLILMSFISLSYPIALARISVVLYWIRVVRVGILFLFLKLEIFQLFFSACVNCDFVIYCLYYVILYIIYCVITKGCSILSNAFSASTLMCMWFLSFILLMWYISFPDLHMLLCCVFLGFCPRRLCHLVY